MSPVTMINIRMNVLHVRKVLYIIFDETSDKQKLNSLIEPSRKLRDRPRLWPKN